jgi:hypothetical protein
MEHGKPEVVAALVFLLVVFLTGLALGTVVGVGVVMAVLR